MGSVMRFTRQNFIDHVFQPYNAAVKRGEYEKIDYNMWKEIRSWAYDDRYSTGWQIRVAHHDDCWTIYPYHNELVTSVLHTIMHSDHSFAAWLTDHLIDIAPWDEDMLDALNASFARSVECGLATGSYAYGSNNYAITSNDSNSINFEVNSDKFYVDGVSLQEHIEKLIKVVDNKEKENNNMKFGNFDFGPVDASVRLSPYGMAIKNSAGKYVAYDRISEQIMDADILNFEGANKFMYKMPVAIDDIEIGDVVVHNRLPMFVLEILGDNRLSVLDVYNGEEKVVVLSQSPFNFNFITKVVSLVDIADSADSHNPFGNMLPLLMMGDSNAKDILPMMLLMNQGGAQMNPLMMYALMGDRKNDDMLPLLMMSGAFAPKHECKCGGKCK